MEQRIQGPRRRALAYGLAAIALLALALAAFPVDRPWSDAGRAFAARFPPGSRGHDVLQIVRPFGKGDTWLFLALLIGAMGYRRLSKRVVAALLVSAALVWPLKMTAGRERPQGGSTVSFPSGDAATAAVCVVPLALHAPGLTPVAGGLALAVAAGRVLDGRHFPSDVLAGLALGLLAGAVACRIGALRRLRLPRGAFLAGAALVVGFRVADYALGSRNRVFADFLTVAAPVVCFLAALRWLRRRAGGRPLGLLFERVAPGLLLAALVCGYFFLTTRSTLWDRDEPRFARATLEMVTSGQYLLPTFNGDLRPDKPILIYWLMSVPMRLLGPVELACRFVAPLGVLAACLLTVWIGRRLLSRSAAWLAGLMVATTPLLTLSGTAATTDALLLACMTGAIAVFADMRAGGVRWRHWAALAVAFAAALLTKGPVGLLPLLVVGATLALDRRLPKPAPRFAWVLGLAVLAGVVLFLAWALPANAASGGEFARKGIGKHVVGRAMAPMESHGGRFLLSLPYYLPVIVAGFFPWTALLPAGFAAVARRHAGGAGARGLLLGWTISIVLLMSLVATKLPHYVLPCWPAFALIAAAGFELLEREPAAREARWLRWGAWLCGLVGVPLAAALLVAPWFLPVPGLRLPLLGLGLLLLALTVAVIRRLRAPRLGECAAAALLGVFLVQWTAGAFVLPAVEQVKLAPPLARAIRAAVPPGTPVATHRYAEPSLLFYLGAGRVESLPGEDDVVRWAEVRRPGVLVAPVEVWEPLWKAGRVPDLEVVASAQGLNYSNGKRVNLIAVRR